MGFLGLAVLKLGRSGTQMRQTDGRTDRQRPSLHNSPSYVGYGVIIISLLGHRQGHNNYIRFGLCHCF